MNALRYLPAFLVPALALVSFWQRGWGTFLAPAFLFTVLPAIELVATGTTANPTEEEEERLRASRWHDVVLWLTVPAQLVVVAALGVRVSQGGLSPLELAGVSLSAGMCAGGIAINAAHELGHRVRPFDRFLARVLLATTLYLHFIVEHNRGHHKRVATPDDPASARRGEHVYAFFVRSIAGSFASAWGLEAARLAKEGRGAWTWRNEVLSGVVLQAVLVAGFASVFGPVAAGCLVASAATGILLLESVNYVEHYGLARAPLGDGRYERVAPHHSWNSNHPLGRVFLFELTRHSDHHAVASRPYPVLRHHDGTPQLPTGYLGMLLLAWVPPLFFAVAHRAIERYEGAGNRRAAGV